MSYCKKKKKAIEFHRNVNIFMQMSYCYLKKTTWLMQDTDELKVPNHYLNTSI